MNCKPGDMAIIVKSWAGNEGKIVTCVKYVGRNLWRNSSYPNGIFDDSWEIDRELPDESGGLDRVIQDSALLPIRPGDLHETEDDLNEVSA